MLSTRTVITGIVAAGVALLAVIAALQVFVAQNIPRLSENALQQARQRWEQRGPKSYDVDLELSGAQPGPVHVEVRVGVVTAATRNGRPTPPRTWDVWSVPGQFETLERELEMAEDPQQEMNAPPGAQLRPSCEFEPNLGYPQRYYRFETGGAPELSWRTTSFKPK
jgi:hypothetical protein